jgi:hypothetical protein
MPEPWQYLGAFLPPVIVHMVGARNDVTVAILSRFAMSGHDGFVLDRQAYRDCGLRALFVKHEIDIPYCSFRSNGGVLVWTPISSPLLRPSSGGELPLVREMERAIGADA